MRDSIFNRSRCSEQFVLLHKWLLIKNKLLPETADKDFVVFIHYHTIDACNCPKVFNALFLFYDKRARKRLKIEGLPVIFYVTK